MKGNLGLREDLCLATYAKVVVRTDGTMEYTTIPCEAIFSPKNHSEWTLRSSDKRHWIIVYSRSATEPNMWWENHVMAYGPDFPVVKGDFCLMRHYKPVQATPAVISRELRQYMITHYHRRREYKFSSAEYTRRNGGW